MIDMTGAWSFGGYSGIAVPETTIKLDLFSDGAREYYKGLFGLSADGSRPIPVEPDGGIGDGAGPIPDGDPMPVEPDSGIGDGAGSIPDGDLKPVEPDSGIGDGAGPIPDDNPMPVEPDGGIGDGAGPPTEVEIDPVEENTIEGGGEGTKANDTFIASEEADTFVFLAGHGDDTVLGFDVTADRLDFSGTEIDFTDVESLLAHATDQVDEDDPSIVYGVYIETGEGSGVYLDGISSADLSLAMIDF